MKSRIDKERKKRIEIEISQRVNEVVQAYLKKEGIKSVRQFCFKHQWNPQTVSKYLKFRVADWFIDELIQVTGASETYIRSGFGEMFITSDKDLLTRSVKGDKEIAVPFGWEASTFAKEKLVNPSHIIRAPFVPPFIKMTKDQETGGGRDMVTLVVDKFADVGNSGLERDSIVFVDFNDTELKKDKVYLLKHPDGTSFFKSKNSNPPEGATVLGRVFYYLKSM